MDIPNQRQVYSYPPPPPPFYDNNDHLCKQTVNLSSPCINRLAFLKASKDLFSIIVFCNVIISLSEVSLALIEESLKTAY